MTSQLQFAGWLLFLLCSVLFIISGIRNNDVWTVGASIVFGLGCVLFLIALSVRRS